MMRTLTTTALLLTVPLFACGGATDPPRGEEGREEQADSITAEMKQSLGKDCFGACGSADPSLRCALPPADGDSCGGAWCLVDHKASSGSFVYCTFDCSAEACPPGYSCDTIDVMGAPGIQRGCIADAPVCNDGIKQRGEVCERGETSEQGECKEDCSGWVSSCGDGIKQPTEVCDGDTTEGYCIDCKEIRPPSLALSNLKIDMESDSYQQWKHVSSASSLVVELPTAGDANDCGRFGVVEDTADLVRVEFTHCSASSQSRATWTVALPRKPGSWSKYDYDEAMMPTARMERWSTPAGSYFFSKESVVREFEGMAHAIGKVIVGSYSVYLVVYGMGEGRRAKLSFSYELLPPIRGGAGGP
jgi:hypothetical protein